ncbi:MAG TPA: hypothetical protein VMT20_17465 [Terriglobia bacterium]|nr:hypothetical protein [Terriglobia bacterium]
MSRAFAVRAGLALAVMLSLANYSRLLADDPAALTQEEEDRIRDAQDPSDRIAIYLELSAERLERFNAIRQAPADASEVAERSATLDQILSQYIALDDELKNWIQDQFDTGHDMRRGLRGVIDVAPKQLALLNQVQQMPDRYFTDYRSSLRDAITDVNDTINGATQALAEQEKKWGALKREEKADAKAAKEALQDEKKHQKQEQKLRKKQDRKGIPEDEDQQN